MFATEPCSYIIAQIGNSPQPIRGVLESKTHEQDTPERFVMWTLVDLVVSFNNRLHTTHFAVFEHHFDAMWVSRTAREDARNNAFGQLASALVLFLNNLDAQTGLDFTAFG